MQIKQKSSKDIVEAIEKILKWKKAVKKYADKYRWEKIIKETVEEYKRI